MTKHLLLPYDFGIKPGSAFCCGDRFGFKIKETYDKFFVLNGLNKVNRAEVAIASMKNKCLLDLKFSSSMINRAEYFTNHIPKGKDDHYFGIFTGQFIPIMNMLQKHTHEVYPNSKYGVGGLTKEIIERTLEQYTMDAINLCDLYFESQVDMWYQVLLGPSPMLRNHAKQVRWVYIEPEYSQYKLTMETNPPKVDFTANYLINPEAYE